MLQEFSINKCTRKCHADGHTLEPGESYFSVIVPGKEDLNRVDISARNWSEPPEGAVGWWKCKMPAAGAKKLKPAPNGVLLDTLAELLEMPGKEKLSYLLALLLVRRQVLLEETNVFDASNETAETAQPTWTLTCKADGRTWDVTEVDPTAREMADLENELNVLLFTEQ